MHYCEQKECNLITILQISSAGHKNKHCFFVPCFRVSCVLLCCDATGSLVYLVFLACPLATPTMCMTSDIGVFNGL